MKKYIDIRVSALSAGELYEFVRLCRTIRTLGMRGNSRSFKVSVDGDGTGKMDFQVINEDHTMTKLPSYKEFDPDNIPDIDIGE